MSIRIIIATICLLLVLIFGTFFWSQERNDAGNDSITNFPIISVPTLNPTTTFDELLTNAPDSIQQKVLDNIYLDEFYVSSCNSGDLVSDVVVLVAQYKQNPQGVNSILTAETAFTAFENTMYKNWGHLIYKQSFQPNLNIVTFSTETIVDSEVLSDKYRVGTLSDDVTKIYYGWVLNYIIVAASKECLLGSMKSVYHIH